VILRSPRLSGVSYAIVGAGLAASLSTLAFVAPLTYDEAFNRFHYAELGLAKTLVTYDYPNNHVPFTALVVAIPQSVVDWNPWSIRLVGVVFGVAMIGLILYAARRTRTGALVPLLVIGGSPTLVAYSFLARGYTFSAVWLVAGALIAAAIQGRNRFVQLWGACAAGVALAVGSWSVLTSVLAVPGWILVVALAAGTPVAFAGAAAYIVALGLMVSPILSGVRAAATGPWNGDVHFWSWAWGAFKVTNAVAPCFVVALVLVAWAAFSPGERPTRMALRTLDGSRRLAVITGTMALSWYVLTAIASAATIIHPPFTRNSIPALWLLVIALIAAFPRGRLGWVVVLLLIPGFAWSASAWTRAATAQDWARLPDIADLNVLGGGTPPSLRSLPGTGATSITCTWYSEMGCQLAAPRLGKEGISVVPLGPAMSPRAHCVVGSVRPPAIWQVTVMRGRSVLGIACY
jgi:hypothetical protein